ncbi:MAG: NAD(P)H-quinone oxidoreductase [Pseudomonadota bacterium]
MFDIPSHMRAVEISKPGGPEVLRVVERPVPTAEPGHVLIKVEVAGVNRPDCLQRAGAYPPPPGASDLPGLEVSGTVVAGPKELLGTSVMALTNGGGYAQYVSVPVGACLPVPPDLDMVWAGAIPETLFTVWHNVFQLGALSSGDVFLVHGGSSGIGTMAIQLARHFGATVIATVGNDQKCEVAVGQGAHHAINYRGQDFVEEVKGITSGAGADVILDMVGGSYVARNHKAAAIGGRIVQIATLGGAKAEFNAGLLMVKRLVHTGSTLRPRSDAFKAALAAELRQRVLHLIADGKIAPLLHSTFELKDAVSAHALMESGEMYGKIALTVEH